MDSIHILKPEYVNRVSDDDLSRIREKIEEFKIHSRVVIDNSSLSLSSFCHELNDASCFITNCCQFHGWDVAKFVTKFRKALYMRLQRKEQKNPTERQNYGNA